MIIQYLVDQPGCVDALAPEIARHWSTILPDETIASRTAKLRSHMNRDTLPIAWVAHTDGEAMGTASLRVFDLHGREDLSPWLGGVFVREKFRRRGVASALCRVAENRAWEIGIQRLYLFTIDQQQLYARLGWEVFEPAMWQGINGWIMTKGHTMQGNHPLEPTTTAVTIRADARLAPAVVVAHLVPSAQESGAVIVK